MKKDDTIYLEHILLSSTRILNYTKNLSEDDFRKNDLVQDAVIRHFEIIGEATKKISLTFRDLYPDVPWEKIIGMRNTLIHNYIDVDLESVWKTITTDILPFRKRVEEIFFIERGKQSSQENLGLK